MVVFQTQIGAKKGKSESRRWRAMYVHLNMNVLTIQKSPARSRVDLDVLSIVLAVSASFLCEPFATRCTFSPEHLLIHISTWCCTGCISWSPKKCTSVPGTFILNVNRWNDHGEVWALRGDKRSRLWYVLRVRLPSACSTESRPLCSLTTSACLNVTPETQTSIDDLKAVPRWAGRGLFCLFVI